jgi:short-subunit dehydrogenase
MLLARALYPGMVERGSGHLVFIASLAGKAASPRTSIYNATKFGLRGFALGLCCDLAPKGVGVSLVSPGFIRDAGMFADSGASAMGLGTGRPDQVGAAVVKAIERGRTEVGVGPLRQRALAHFALSTPALSARAQSGAAGQRIAGGLADGHPQHKR